MVDVLEFKDFTKTMKNLSVKSSELVDGQRPPEHLHLSFALLRLTMEVDSRTYKLSLTKLLENNLKRFQKPLQVLLSYSKES
jgi:hypothetical protein